MNTSDTIEFFGSLQNPYCYFALDRLKALNPDLGVQIVMRSVLPGVIRTPDAYADRSPMERAYFQQDVVRTAQFLDFPFNDPKPSPVYWHKCSLWIAKPDQTRIKRLYNLLYQAHMLGKEYPLYAMFMRLIWSRQTCG